MRRWILIGLAGSLVATAAVAGERTITSSNYFGCQDRGTHRRLVGFAVDRDNDAFAKGLMAEVLAGQCYLFTAGETVYLEDTAMFSGVVQLRPRGSTRSYWTAIEAIRR